MRVEGLAAVTPLVTSGVKRKGETAFSKDPDEERAGQSNGGAEPEAEPVVGLANRSPMGASDTWIEEVASTQTLDALEHIHPIQHEIADYGAEFADEAERRDDRPTSTRPTPVA